MSNTAETSLLAALFDTDSLESLVREGLPPECIPTEALRPVVSWATDRFFESGRVQAPSRDALLEVWETQLQDANLEVPGENEQVDNIEWAIDHLKSQYVYYTYQQWQKNSAMEMAAATSTDRVDILNNQIGVLMNMSLKMQPRHRSVDFADSFAQSFDDYQGRESAKQASRGLTFGIPMIDEHTFGIHAGELAVVAAPPKTGKSYFLNYVALREAQNGRRVALFTLENSVEMTIDRLVCFALGINSRDWQRGKLSAEDKERVRWYQNDELPLLKDNLRIISPEPGRRSPESMYREAQTIGAESMIVDQLTFVEHPQPNANRSRHVVIGDLMRDFKQLISTGRDQMPCILAHQINREGVKAAEKTGKFEMYMLAEGAEVERASDWVFSLYQSNMQREVFQATFQILASRREDVKAWEMDWRTPQGIINAMREAILL